MEIFGMYLYLGIESNHRLLALKALMPVEVPEN